MASRLAVHLTRANALPRTASCARVISRTYVVASATTRPAVRTAVRPKVAPHASTYATTSEAEAEFEALATSNGVGNGNKTDSLPSSTSGAQSPADSLESFSSAFSTDTSAGTMTDWSRSYHGLGAQPFPKEASDVLLAPIDPNDIEMKPDGLAYLPEIKYRRVLNKAFGPGGWGLAPRSETNVGPKVVSREYALICLGRLVAVARGEQEYFDTSGIATAVEACKSNALMRCCKDLGIASELWDPRFLREFKAKYCVEVYAEHVTTKKKKKLFRRKDQPKFDYPFKE